MSAVSAAERGGRLESSAASWASAIARCSRADGGSTESANDSRGGVRDRDRDRELPEEEPLDDELVDRARRRRRWPCRRAERPRRLRERPRRVGETDRRRRRRERPGRPRPGGSWWRSPALSVPESELPEGEVLRDVRWRGLIERRSWRRSRPYSSAAPSRESRAAALPPSSGRPRHLVARLVVASPTWRSFRTQSSPKFAEKRWLCATEQSRRTGW